MCFRANWKCRLDEKVGLQGSQFAVLAGSRAAIARACGGSSTPRPLGSITAAFGILGGFARSSRATTGSVWGRHSGTRLLARARNPYAVTVVVLRAGRRLSLNQRWTVAMDSGLVLRTPRNDEQNYSRGAFPPEFCNLVVPPRVEGAGNAGCALHPRSRVQSLR